MQTKVVGGGAVHPFSFIMVENYKNVVTKEILKLSYALTYFTDENQSKEVSRSPWITQLLNHKAETRNQGFDIPVQHAGPKPCHLSS